jgi:hypothetical protein
MLQVSQEDGRMREIWYKNEVSKLQEMIEKMRSDNKEIKIKMVQNLYQK